MDKHELYTTYVLSIRYTPSLAVRVCMKHLKTIFNYLRTNMALNVRSVWMCLLEVQQALPSPIPQTFHFGYTMILDETVVETKQVEAK